MKNKRPAYSFKVGQTIFDDLIYKDVSIIKIGYDKSVQCIKVQLNDAKSRRFNHGWRLPWEITTY